MTNKHIFALIFGAILGVASIKLKVEADPIVEKIDAILPQSQCGQCGYPGCKPYAEAIANGDVITNVKFYGGCDGNLKAIPALVNGLTVDEISNKLSGIQCGFKGTSCGDQLAHAVREAYEAEKAANA